MSHTPDSATRRANIHKFLRFCGLAWGLIAAGLLLFWIFGGFRHMGLNLMGAAALVIGILGTCAIGIGLMALVFYSAQSNADEEAYRYQRPPPPERDEPKQ